MKTNINQISATEFKKHFLSLVDEVRTKHSSFIIAKRKLPVARISPIEEHNNLTQKSYFGSLKGTVKIKDDIISYNCQSDWEAKNE